MKKNILVFPCGSEVALEIAQSVKHSRFFHLIGASSVDDHGRFAFPDYCGELPFVDDPGFIPALAELVSERQVDAIMPAMDSVAALLKENEAELGCVVVAPPADATKTCASKRQTYDALRGIVPLPRDFTGEDPAGLDYPVFAKPVVGYGSRGAKKLDSEEALAAHLDVYGDCLILEYLPGEEYTIDCFTNFRGELLYAGGRVRGRVRNGISVRSWFPEGQSEFVEFASKVNGAMGMRGAWFVQVKRDSSGGLKLLEVAARLAGASALSRARGVNLALLSLFDAFGYIVGVDAGGYQVELDRALGNAFAVAVGYGCAYVDYDDCLVYEDGTVNTDLVKFVYQCVNDGVEVVLLSKHEGDLDASLRERRLDRLFDRVIHIDRDANKTDFIDRLDAIFIDDSFAERSLVRLGAGIPVFSPDMVECLTRP